MHRGYASLCIGGLIRGLICGLVCGLIGISSNGLASQHLCHEAVAYHEAQSDHPEGLIAAIAHTESGHRPWAIRHGATSHIAPTKEAAIAYVQRLQAQGVRNIDVGCMQVNLAAHPTAFVTLEEAFDPYTNVGYAVAFLTRLKATTPSFMIPSYSYAADYHSKTPQHHATYKKKFLAAWLRILKRQDEWSQASQLQFRDSDKAPKPKRRQPSTRFLAKEVFTGTTKLPKGLLLPM